MPRKQLPRQALLVVLILFLSLNANAAANLQIAAGETYTVTKAQQNLELRNLTIGDGATIQFADTVRYWQVSAESARLGNDVRINAAGNSGAPAPALSREAKQACEPVPGETGLAGEAGSDGVNISLRFVQAQIGGLTIDARGGTGGAGGQGGPGSSAANCKNGDGGRGGNGGRGGQGGHGGQVIVELGSSVATWQQLSQAIKILTDAGKGGRGGDVGLPGAAAPGRYIDKKTLVGNRKWVAGGAEGEAGKPGKQGVSGRQGTAMVRPLVASMAQLPGSMHKTEPLIESNQAVGYKRTESDHIQQMENELRALRQRIEQLEQKFREFSREKH